MYSQFGKRVFIFLKGVYDPKNVKNPFSGRIGDQFVLTSLALLLHLVYFQGMCVEGRGDLNLFLTRKICFYLEAKLKKNSPFVKYHDTFI